VKTKTFYNPETQEVVIIEFAELLCSVPEPICKQAIKAGLEVISSAAKSKPRMELIETCINPSQ